MLINTVVLLLRELLPLIVLVSLLLALFPASANRLLYWSLALAMPALALQSSLYQTLAAAVDGQGLEVWYATCYFLCGAALLATQLSSRRVLPLLVLALLTLVLVNGSNLVLYLAVYPRQSEESQSLWLGAALGGGISISIGVLWYHLSRELLQVWPRLAVWLLALCCARQISAGIAILQQMDWLDGTPLWNSQAVLAENSELGYLLNAVLGYEASPSAWQLSLYLLVMIICWVLAQRGQRYD
jgi:high-affinity iron transporter